MGLFEKKHCSICNKEIGLLGTVRLEDGVICKNCSGKLSPFFTGRKKTTVNVNMKSQQGAMVAPLLFISLIENAFKHGVSSNQKSDIDISLTADDGLLTFVCDNTNHPKDDADRSGSGIGLENTRRRLQLLYPDKHTWEQTLVNDIYHIKITIQL